MQQSRTKTLVVSALIAALYVVLSVVPGVFNLASGAIQFRISEGLNHLVVFSKKIRLRRGAGRGAFQCAVQFVGLDRCGVRRWAKLDRLSRCRLSGTTFAEVVAENGPQHLRDDLDHVFDRDRNRLDGAYVHEHAFLGVYGSLMLSEAVIMAITAPIMAALDRVLHFKKINGLIG